MNPFTERSRITDPARFIGRWREVSMVFERLERRRPALVVGPPGIGKSSLITHVAQSAGAVLELPRLEALFLDLALLPDGAAAYQLIARALGRPGASEAALRAGLLAAGRPVLIVCDGADAAVAAGWGAELLERLARLARASVVTPPADPLPPPEGAWDLMLLAAAGAEPPRLSEPFAVIGLGAMAGAEQRMLADVYLDEGAARFSPDELRELSQLSAGHPAYLQRAAYHLFQARGEPGYDWRAAYLAEAGERPIPGAPLPPEVFVGAAAPGGQSSLSDPDGPGARPAARQTMEVDSPAELLLAALPVVAALVAWQLASWPLGLLALVAGYALLAWRLRRG